MKTTSIILLSIICTSLACAAPGKQFPGRAEIQGLKYISDPNTFVHEHSKKLTLDQKKALQFAKSVLALYLGTEIRGQFSIAEAGWGYQMNFTKIQKKQKEKWTEAVEGFGEVFLNKHFNRIQIDYGP